MAATEKLLHWYEHHKRNLPWRNTTDPYKIWLSEIILQQTRVEQGLWYYYRFVEQYPTVFDLANASEEEVLKLWQGLGYYSRARNLHATAKQLVSMYAGIFPASYVELLKLKGVGAYTAAAIASFAFRLPHAVVDGNVYRVLSRYMGIKNAIDSTLGKKKFEQLANDFLNLDHPDLHNQAMMELGATVCTPVKPNCKQCPLQSSCWGAENPDAVENLPVKQQKIQKRDRFFNYLVLIHNNGFYVNKRTEKDVWHNLYDFPMIESEQNLLNKTKIEDFVKDNFCLKTLDFELINPSKVYKHILSHQTIHACFWNIQIFVKLEDNFVSSYSFQDLKSLERLPIPKLMEIFKNKELLSWLKID